MWTQVSTGVSFGSQVHSHKDNIINLFSQAIKKNIRSKYFIFLVEYILIIIFKRCNLALESKLSEIQKIILKTGQNKN